MARCGCNSTCACVIRAGDNVTITGAGSPASPMVVNAQKNSCPEIVTCLCANLNPGVECQGGKLGVAISTDDGNIASFGTDGGVLVPGSQSGGIVVANTDQVELGGAGLPAAPLTAKLTRVNIPTAPFTAASGFEIANFQGSLIAGTWLEGQVSFRRTGPEIKSGTGNGNISPDVDLCSITPGYWPRTGFYESCSTYWFFAGVWYSAAGWFNMKFFCSPNLGFPTGEVIVCPLRYAIADPNVPASVNAPYTNAPVEGVPVGYVDQMQTPGTP